MKNLNLLNKLIEQEKSVSQNEILSPVIPNTKVCVKIDGVIVSLNVRPANFTGWGIFKTDQSFKNANFIEEPNRRQQREYLEMLPRAIMIVCEHNENRTVGSFLNNDDRFPFDAAPIFFPHNISLFDVIHVRFNGQYFIYERHQAGKYQQLTEECRDLLNKETKPDRIKIAFGFARAYAYAYEVTVKQKIITAQDKVKTAIERAGGKFKNLVDRGGIFTVSFEVEGETFTPTVNANNLMLENAGICLSGRDRSFDLESFVHVTRKGIQDGVIVRGDYLRVYGDRSRENG